jgi:RNA 2',3'-cyclic 3'-phosphodiesterase
VTETARLFAALELPEPVASELVKWQQSVLSSRAALRVIGRGALHVTLCFLGERPVTDVPRISAGCEAVGRMAAGGLALGGPVWLPRRRPNVLAVAVEDDRGELRALQSVLAGALIDAGVFRAEPRIFFPHVTAARVRHGERVRPATLEAPAPLEFAGKWATLFRSRLGDGQAQYETLHRVALAAG